MICIQRLFALEDIPQEVKDAEIQVDTTKWPLQGQVEFINATLRYRPNTDIVLKNLSFVVIPRTKVGVVGRTGAGKSTICLSLSRIVELCGGKIEIDGIDIRKIDLQILRRKITVISQDPTLFKGSLRFNLDPFGKVSDSHIEQLLIKAGLKDLLHREVEGELDNYSERQSMADKTESVESGEEENKSLLRSLSTSSKNKEVKGINFKIEENGSNLSAG